MITALRFLFTVTLERQEAVKKLCPIHEPRRLPEVLSPEEITRVINTACAFKYKTVLSVAYSAGLRAKETCHLRINNVDKQGVMDQPVPIVKAPLFLHSPFAFVLTMARLKPIIRITIP
mgnify:CR=1 FL=1